MLYPLSYEGERSRIARNISLSEILRQVQAKAVRDYYLQKLVEISPREDYYLRGGTATGRWCGSGVTELGLAGSVSAEGLVRLFDGNHPGTGEQLSRRLGKDGAAAWDVTFSADKAVSLLWALGDELTRKEVLKRIG